MKDNGCEKILEYLKENLKPFSKDSDFSENPGIYAVGLNCIWEFSLSSTKIKLEPNEVIYIGKTEKSQISRDIDTHFENGKSGSSTLRRSLGAILKKELKLTPIPRSCTENGNGRFTNYKFTSDGEEKLTKWMEANLSLSYCEWNGSIEELRETEKKIIKLICPILNLQNNAENKYKTKIKKLRKECRDSAEKNKNLCK